MTSKKRREALIQAAVRAARVGLWEWNIRTNSVVFSAEWKRLLGYGESEIPDEFGEWERRLHPDDLPRMKQLLADYLKDPWPDYQAEFRMRHKDGSWRWILTQADILRDKRGKPTHMIGSHIDITEEKRAAAELARSNRALRMLSQSNQTLIRTNDEDTLLREVCRIAVEVGGYRMAWAGFAEPDSSFTVGPVAHAGFEEGYLAEARITWGESGAQGPVATAIRTGRPAIVREIPVDPAFASRREAARERGYQSAIALPLLKGDRAFGVFKIYSIEPDAFDDAEVAILSELAGDVAYGILAIRTRAEHREAEAALRRTEADLQLALEASGLGDWSWNILTGEIIWSARCKALYGLPVDAVITYERFLEAVHPDDRARTEAALQQAVASRSDYEIEKRVVWPDGSIHWNISRGRVFSDDTGQPVRMAGVTLDVTERKRQLYLLNFALDNVGEGIYLLPDNSPRFMYVNQSAAQTLGYSREELTGGMSIFDIDPAWNEEAWRRFWPEILAKRRMTIESTHRTRDGRLLPVEITGNLFEFEGKLYNLAIVRDISERKLAHEAAIEREREYRTLADHIPDFIVRWDRSLRRVYANPAFAAALGLPADQLIGTGFGTGYSRKANEVIGNALQIVREQIQTVFSTGETVVFEAPWLTTTGPRMVHLRLVPERDAVGTVSTVLGIGRDITALKETERQIRTLTDHSPDIILRFDCEGRYLYANEALERLTGVPAADHVGRHLGEVTGRGEKELYRSLRLQIGEVCESSSPREAELTLPLADGDHIFHVRLVPEPDDAGAIVSVLAVARDITERQRAEEALRGSEQRFRQVTENIDEVFWLTDAAKTEMIYVSPAYDRLFGRDRETLYADARAWLDVVQPEHRERVAEAMVHQAEGGYDLEYPIVRSDGIRWIHDRAFPIRDAEGKVYRIAGVAEDVTVRRQLEDQLRQAQKMEAVGQLAGGIAHDFNNMLAVIQMQSTMLLDDVAWNPEIRDGIREVLAATARAANLTRQLLTFSRRQVSQPIDLDISNTIANMTKLLRRILGEDIALETRFASSLPLIHADPGMMEQVLMNLAVNARDAMPNGGRLTVALEPVIVDDQGAALHPGASPGRYVCLTVTDTGIGIPADALPRIFEPFFTTKEIGKGTGLGLATVFGIVEEHQGWINVDSVVGRGTTFKVVLPALSTTAEAHVATSPEAVVRGGNETVLLVEDEPAVRVISRDVLERYGYRVLEADSAAEAMEIWAREGPTVQLLLTDLIMPGGVSGRQLAQELLAREPRLRVIYTTGYSPEVVNRMMHLDPGHTLLEKPYAAAELAASVRRALDEPRRVDG